MHKQLKVYISVRKHMLVFSIYFSIYQMVIIKTLTAALEKNDNVMIPEL